jgi:hypothetical protein
MWRVIADIASAVVLIFMFVVTPLWCHYDPAWTNHGPPGAPIPIQLVLFAAAIIPGIAGVVWLTYRYGERLNKKWPFILTPAFRYTLWTTSVTFVLLMEYLWKVQ